MKRLNAILEYINSSDIVCDVGCDHGYLLKLALDNKNIKKGYAVDNKIGPLESAKFNLKDYSNIIFCLSDGLTKVDYPDINCVVIAGMGGMLINKIFLDSLSKFNNINKVIVAPNKNVDKVRKTFTNNGYMINNESILVDDDITYEIIEFIKGKQALNKNELMFGPYLLKNKNEAFINKWTSYLNKIKNVESKQNEVKMIEEVLK